MFYFSEKNAFPLLKNLLDADPSRLFHEQHEIKQAHPADILTEKLNRINAKFQTFWKNRSLETQCGDSKNDPKIESISDYILELDSFYDSLFLIIKCFEFPQGQDNKDAIKWLQGKKSNIYHNFLGSTKQSQKLFRDIANKLKHDHVSISILTVHNHKNIPVDGFYIQSIVGPNDQRGPDPDIHKPYKRSATAMSYNHFALHSIGCLFLHLDKLNKSLFPKNSSNIFEQSAAARGIIFTCEFIEHDFYPDEYEKPFIGIKRVDADKVSLIYPHRYKKSANEFFDKINRVNAPRKFNQRTDSSNGIIPYLPLLYQ
ncbi:MAG: hypothetical protein DU489_08805 [Nitrosomonas sp.]|uniref:hypothetical protein n=1 Tax=Nitrosomonas sp. TaxID=42353 RepID=UPI0032EB8697